MRHFDVIIIGTGTGGGTLAYALARSGKKILLIERGRYLPREPDNWNSQQVFLNRKYCPNETWYDDTGEGYPAPTHYCVGGNTKFYGAALMRFRPRDFEELVHPDGISPAWPIRYEELEPYYTQAERLYHVHGQRGLDPAEPPASNPYPYEMVPHEPRIQALSDDMHNIGLHSFPLPLGIMLNEGDSETRRCIRCGTCGGFPCMISAKADAQTVCVEPALRYSHIELITQACVRRLEVSASGREVTSVVVDRNDNLERYSADLFVVACGAVNSAALLLRSASDKHPHGLANSSGVVGRHYMRHTNTSFIAMSHEPNFSVFQKTLGINDFYFGDGSWEYPMGNVQLLGKSTIDVLQAERLHLPANLSLMDVFRRAIEFCVISEDLPDPNNRVALDERGEITLRYVANNLSGHQRLLAKMQEIIGKLGCEERLFPTSVYVGGKSSVMGANHQCGTVRFGRDPKTSALDVHCKAHELDNLYVVDSSFFVSSAAVNPALTIIANALRVGHHLSERLS